MVNKPKRQHYVPQCYLREWADPRTPANKEPCVWIFDKDGENRRKDKVRNILAVNDLYTVRIKGQKDYSIEETLSNLESRYAQVFREKIEEHLPLTEEEHVILCAFVSVMLQRTLRHKDNLERFIDELIARTEELEKAHNAPLRKSKELKHFKENIHKVEVVQSIPDITELLFQMRVAFLCAEKRSNFITSDDPCNLFNPDLQWQRFYGPGLAQRKVQVTLPLSPEIMLCLSWSNLGGYILWNKRQVEEANRMIRGFCYKYFISHTSKAKRHWFRSYPFDFWFILKIINHKIRLRMQNLKMRSLYRNVRNK
jgi:hypothetical protein